MAQRDSDRSLILDASVVVAVAIREPGYESLLERILAAEESAIGAPSLVEAMIVLSSKLGKDARPVVRDLLRAWGTEVVAFTEHHVDSAVHGFLRYGKGRHKASLNYGDCLTYGVAQESGSELAYCGVDFTHTDLKRRA